MRALLRSVVYVVAVAGGIDAYLVAGDHLPAAVAALVALAVAGFLATVPTPVYQAMMRAIARRRRGANTSTPVTEPATGPAPVTAAPAAARSGSAPVAGTRVATGLLAGPGPDPRLWPEGRPEPPSRYATAAPALPGPEPGGAHEPADGPPRPGAEVVADCQDRLAEALRTLGPDHQRTFAARLDLAAAVWALGQLDQATTAYETIAADCARALGEADPQTLACRNQLAAAYEMDGRLDEAIALYQYTLDARARVLGPRHPDTEMSRRDLAIAQAVRTNLNRGRPDA